MTLGPTQPLAEMSTRYLPGVKSGRRVRLITSSPSVSRLSRENEGVSISHKPMDLHGMLEGEFFLPFNILFSFINFYMIGNNIFLFNVLSLLFLIWNLFQTLFFM
jgi:hypothetical protein